MTLRECDLISMISKETQISTTKYLFEELPVRFIVRVAVVGDLMSQISIHIKYLL